MQSTHSTLDASSASFRAIRAIAPARVRTGPRAAAVSYVEPSALSETERVAIWRLRLAYCRTEGCSPERLQGDRARFCRSIDGYTLATLGRDPSGRIVYAAFFGLRSDRETGTLELTLGSQYRLPGWRCPRAYLGVYLHVAAWLLPDPFRRRVVVISDVSLSGYARILKTFRNEAHLWFDGDADAPEPVRRAMVRQREVDPASGISWDEELGLLCYPLPMAIPVHHSDLSAEELARYTERNPDPGGPMGGHRTIIVGAQGTLLSLLSCVSRRLLGYVARCAG